FILLNEQPQGWLPRFRPDRVIFYVGQGLVLAIIMIIGSIPLLFLILILPASTVILNVLVIGSYITMLILSFYRLAVTLPARAIGKDMTLDQAWKATSSSFWTLIVLVLLSHSFQYLLQFLFGMFALIPVVGPLLVLIPSLLLLPLINVSVLTTLYGVYVEGRPLNE
ncbi:hypothetical protein AB9K41_28975, partial [Cribrihabitans sp. XS_ASV171]